MLLIPSAKCRQEANLRICKFPEHDFVPVGTLTLIQAATVCQGLRPYYCATSKKGFRPIAEIWSGLHACTILHVCLRVWVFSCTKWKFMLWNSGSHQMKRSILFFYKKVHKTVPPPYLLETKQFEGSIFSKETLTWHESRKLRSTSIKEKPDIWWVALQSNNINETWKGRLKSKTWQ